ncbi:MAG: hypothetical protein JWL63_2709 [Rhodocyclales bacterium]|nr:hypothetical protein [Rhodocyclales bacterium]
MSKPFARALQMMALIAAAMQTSMPSVAMAKIGPYRSRGKGLGKTTYASKLTHNKNSHGGCYMPREGGGARECAHRVRQMAEQF